MDRILARFKIQTKVIVLVLPLLLTIVAVGATGLYATGVLEARLSTSNDVVRLLSGFKGVYAGITTFLREPDDATFKQASDTTAAQISELDRMITVIPDAQAAAELRKAQEATRTILSHINEIWKLRQDRFQLTNNIAAQLEALNSVQMELGKHAFKIVAQAAQLDNKRKSRLSETLALQSILSGCENLQVQLRSLEGQSLGHEGTAVRASLEGLAHKLSKSDRLLISMGVRDGSRIADRISAFLNQSGSQATGGQLAALAIANDLAGLTESLRVQSAAAVEQAAADLNGSSGGSVDADKVTKKLRSIVSNGSDVKIAFASLLGEPTADNVKAVERTLFVYAGEIRLLTELATIDSYFGDVPGTVGEIADKLRESATGLEANRGHAEEQYRHATDKINEIWGLMDAFADAQRQMASTERSLTNSVSLTSMAIGFLVAIASGAALVVTLKRPIGSITEIMRRLAGGSLDIAIDGDQRKDEIGEMARALAVFKENANQKIAIQARTEELHRLAESEREMNDRERASTQKNIELAVTSLAGGLRNLASRDLRNTIETPFAGDLDILRQDFNSTISDLSSTMLDLRATSAEIHTNGRLLADASEELSRRNEQQAGSIEQTAAAIEEITITVAEASKRATSAADIVQRVKLEADGSLVIVENAIGAMSRIKEASDRITSIVTVIDGIAFQTNLLALNAGVEAARAGEAGKGFAVVAHEVRELAQRAAFAAKEIGTLIHHSTTEVDAGVDFVEQAGHALDDIALKIGAVSRDVGQLAVSSQSQAKSLNEINDAVSTMERVTQLNAAMAEEAGAATRRLAEQVDDLVQLVGSFALNEPPSVHAERAA
ncbi:methyl-accepting chemotaxis protein [Rhizobium etli]|uniref:methyl-accepting chemotaxis protein n=1 Tax=Rhizobium etli TaxID=29449 RepID=UPI000383A659|nr:methyl-accepting chemotaxis protein [Rhizobium etli]AGS26477.1 methyl-accepting chemotaxis protein [Rhizobium etli bv. mimosae str. Mim1]